MKLKISLECPKIIKDIRWLSLPGFLSTSSKMFSETEKYKDFGYQSKLNSLQNKRSITKFPNTKHVDFYQDFVPAVSKTLN